MKTKTLKLAISLAALTIISTATTFGAFVYNVDIQNDSAATVEVKLKDVTTSVEKIVTLNPGTKFYQDLTLHGETSYTVRFFDAQGNEIMKILSSSIMTNKVFSPKKLYGPNSFNIDDSEMQTTFGNGLKFKTSSHFSSLDNSANFILYFGSKPELTDL